MTTPIITVKSLQTELNTSQGKALAVDDVSFSIEPGKTLALVGESGCGKSMTSLSIMRLIPEPPAKIIGGEVLFDGIDLLKASEWNMRKIRGNSISMIFQEPMTSLNPLYRVGNQIGEVFRNHQQMSPKDARDASIEMLKLVGIPAPESRIDDFPHQLSGGMRQRVMIAMALAGKPKLLIADEPTTALDVTIQAQILDLLRNLQQELGTAILLITHDLGVVAEMADDVAMMYAGRIVQHAPIKDLFANPGHPYTHGLFTSIPSLENQGEVLETIEGQVPTLSELPDGCRFHPRCPYTMDKCRVDSPPIVDQPDGSQMACWLYDQAIMNEQNLPIGIPTHTS
jgi:oligopeptide/dipeptide ABC transporter ATP-binding protein